MRTQVIGILLLFLGLRNVMGDCGNIKECGLANWFPWSTCSASCGVGVRDRWRAVCCKEISGKDYFVCLRDCNITTKEAKQENVACTNTTGCASMTKEQTTTESTSMSSTLKLVTPHLVQKTTFSPALWTDPYFTGTTIPLTLLSLYSKQIRSSWSSKFKVQPTAISSRYPTTNAQTTLQSMTSSSLHPKTTKSHTTHRPIKFSSRNPTTMKVQTTHQSTTSLGRHLTKTKVQSTRQPVTSNNKFLTSMKMPTTRQPTVSSSRHLTTTTYQKTSTMAVSKGNPITTQKQTTALQWKSTSKDAASTKRYLRSSNAGRVTELAAILGGIMLLSAVSSCCLSFLASAYKRKDKDEKKRRTLLQMPAVKPTRKLPPTARVHPTAVLKPSTINDNFDRSPYQTKDKEIPYSLDF